MTSLHAQDVIDEWNNGINLVDILEVMLPQASTFVRKILPRTANGHSVNRDFAIKPALGRPRAQRCRTAPSVPLPPPYRTWLYRSPAWHTCAHVCTVRIHVRVKDLRFSVNTHTGTVRRHHVSLPVPPQQAGEFNTPTPRYYRTMA